MATPVDPLVKFSMDVIQFCDEFEEVFAGSSFPYRYQGEDMMGNIMHILGFFPLDFYNIGDERIILMWNPHLETTHRIGLDNFLFANFLRLEEYLGIRDDLERLFIDRFYGQRVYVEDGRHNWKPVKLVGMKVDPTDRAVTCAYYDSGELRQCDINIIRYQAKFSEEHQKYIPYHPSEWTDSSESDDVVDIS
ncbi:uncharacterized protein LOC116338282 [Contarinia nasturtii]|uniref:uncharacterized protein LOC116338282 n=1 Tax=Contarinia nasturtii TaxID=265458 RepID=UPI0012D37A2F|nr:uncharacterized protein LOC116338282 [Contarinia nasturtii]